MSIATSFNLINSLNNRYFATLTYNWLVKQVDWTKLTSRLIIARNNPHEQVKCVLVEYNHSAQHTDPFVQDMMPGTPLTVDKALNSNKFKLLFHEVFLNNNPSITFYTRRKIMNGNTPDFTRKQFVIVIPPFTFAPPPPPPPSAQSAPEGLDELYSVDEDSEEEEPVENTRPMKRARN